VLTLSNFRNMGGRVIPATMKMITLKKHREQGETGEEYTRMEIKDVKFNEKIPNSVFSLQNLKRR